MAIEFNEIMPVHNENQIENAIANAAATGQPTEIRLMQNINLTHTINVTQGVTVRFASPGNNVYVLNAGKKGFRVMTVGTQSTATTTIYIGNVRLTGGYLPNTGSSTEDDGGAIRAGNYYASSGISNIVIENNAEIDGNEARYGGGIFVNGTITILGGRIHNNKAREWGGGIYVYPGKTFMEGGTVSDNQAIQGGGLFTSDIIMTGGNFISNTATDFGGGIEINGGGSDSLSQIGGSAIIADNTAGRAGGGIMRAGNLGIVELKAGAQITGNRANGNLNGLSGGGIYVFEFMLASLKVEEGVVFSNNSAPQGYLTRKPEDNAIYYANIHGTIWTIPFTQGFNNFDIGYVGLDPFPEPVPGEPCEVNAQQMVEVCLPVQVRPFARVGQISTRCCGPAIIRPGILCPGPIIENCNFTVSQRICVEVPVEFGANVTPEQPHTNCTGERCESCPNQIAQKQ